MRRDSTGSLFQPSAPARLNHICTPDSYVPDQGTGGRDEEGERGGGRGETLSFDSVFNRPALRGKTSRFRYRLLDLDTVVSRRQCSLPKDARRIPNKGR